MILSFIMPVTYHCAKRPEAPEHHSSGTIDSAHLTKGRAQAVKPEAADVRCHFFITEGRSRPIARALPAS